MILPSNNLKLDQFYILNDDSIIKFNKTIVEDNTDQYKLLNTYLDKSKFKDSQNAFLNKIDIISEETLKIIEKQLILEFNLSVFNSITVKKITKESLNLIFKFLGFNIVYCLQLAENVFTNLINFIKLKYDNYDFNNNASLLENGAICTHDVFFEIVKLTIIQISKKKCHFKKYFHLAYLSVSIKL